MVKIITADKEIAHLQNQFKKNLRLFMEQTIYCKMGFSGGYVEDKGRMGRIGVPYGGCKEAAYKLRLMQLGGLLEGAWVSDVK